MDHQTKDHLDLCLRLVLFQPINWTYAEYIKGKTGAYKVTTGFNKGRIVNWGFAHFNSEEEREKAAVGLKEMFHENQILEKIISFNYGPPECCYLCGQVSHLAGNKRHKQDQCPLRKTAPPKADVARKESKNVRFAPWAQTNQNKPKAAPAMQEARQHSNSRVSTPLFTLSNSFAAPQGLEEKVETINQENKDETKESKPLEQPTRKKTAINQEKNNETKENKLLEQPASNPKLKRIRSSENLSKKAKDKNTQQRSSPPRALTPPPFKWTALSLLNWGSNGRIETNTNENIAPPTQQSTPNNASTQEPHPSDQKMTFEITIENPSSRPSNTAPGAANLNEKKGNIPEHLTFSSEDRDVRLQMDTNKSHQGKA